MLLVDYFDFDSLQILEENKSTGTMKLQGICQRAGVPNKNNRIYEKTLLEREFKKLTPMIGERRLIGELDHPTGPTVSLKNASHIITEVTFKGDDALCIVELLNTPAGKVAQSLIKDGVKLGISSRAVGSLESPGNDGVQRVNENDFKLITWDLVADPSTKEAFIGINESVEGAEGENISFKKRISAVIRERLIIETFKQKFVNEDTRSKIESKIRTLAASEEAELQRSARAENRKRGRTRRKETEHRIRTRTALEQELEKETKKKSKTKGAKAVATQLKKAPGQAERRSSPRMDRNHLVITNIPLIKEYLDYKSKGRVTKKKRLAEAFLSEVRRRGVYYGGPGKQDVYGGGVIGRTTRRYKGSRKPLKIRSLDPSQRAAALQHVGADVGKEHKRVRRVSIPRTDTPGKVRHVTYSKRGQERFETPGGGSYKTKIDPTTGERYMLGRTPEGRVWRSFVDPKGKQKMQMRLPSGGAVERKIKDGGAEGRLQRKRPSLKPKPKPTPLPTPTPTTTPTPTSPLSPDHEKIGSGKSIYGMEIDPHKRSPLNTPRNRDLARLQVKRGVPLQGKEGGGGVPASAGSSAEGATAKGERLAAAITGDTTKKKKQNLDQHKLPGKMTDVELKRSYASGRGRSVDPETIETGQKISNLPSERALPTGRLARLRTRLARFTGARESGVRRSLFGDPRMERSPTTGRLPGDTPYTKGESVFKKFGRAFRRGFAPRKYYSAQHKAEDLS